MKFILAEKKEMTQKFGPSGEVVPVTRVVAGPCTVVQVKTKEKDGYDAVQIGFGKKKSLNKPQRGHLKNLGDFRYLKEFTITDQEAEQLAIGANITAKTFAVGDKVKVTGTSKGRGFQGVVKRHGFHGSPATHGHKDQLRMPGSIGAGGVQHVFKGVRMGGHMGADQVTVANLEVVEVQGNEIFIKGAVPGHINNLLLISANGELLVEKEAPAAEPAADVAAENVETPEAAPETKEENPSEAQQEAATPEQPEKQQEEVKADETK